MYLMLVGAILVILLTFLPSKSTLRWIYILIKTIPRDIRIMISVLAVVRSIAKYKFKDATVSKIFSKNVKKHPNKIAYHFEDDSWTFEQVDEFSNKIANIFEQQGYRKGDTVALLLENCIQYPSIWLGLSKIGVITALINTNLVKDSLLHCIDTAKCKAIIFGTEHVEVIREVKPQLVNKKLFQYDKATSDTQNIQTEFHDLNEQLQSVSSKIKQAKNGSINDHLLYIYTSGTTGLPKAALITHLKFISAGTFFKEVTGFSENEIIYTPLPLYHSAGGIGGAGQPLILGATAVLKKKFSASNYFKDCAKYKATVGQYIGEQCRYLLAVAESEFDNYPLKALIGNGLKPQIWKRLIKRFNVKRIVEAYGATEGNVFLANTEGVVGAIGFIPRYLKPLIGITTIKYDEVTGEPLRNEDGFCVKCNVGEPGVIVAKLNLARAILRYDGYTDKKESKKKLLRNVFRNGDAYFNSGDIVEYDEFGYYFFKDRTGDTFRWKGENVSTSEIESIISNILDLSDVTVYGVELPNTEGRAGMAAILDKDKSLPIDEIGQTFKQHLPSYAIPLFIRIVDSVPVTGTFKLKKTDLREEGYNINKVKDDLYFYQSKLAKYVPLTEELHKDIQSGILKI